jgi:hypothetical protein
MGGDHALFQGNSLDTLSITTKQCSHDARKIADVWNGCLLTKNLSCFRYTSLIDINAYYYLCLFYKFIYFATNHKILRYTKLESQRQVQDHTNLVEQPKYLSPAYFIQKRVNPFSIESHKSTTL